MTWEKAAVLWVWQALVNPVGCDWEAVGEQNVAVAAAAGVGRIRMETDCYCLGGRGVTLRARAWV